VSEDWEGGGWVSDRCLTAASWEGNLRKTELTENSSEQYGSTLSEIMGREKVEIGIGRNKCPRCHLQRTLSFVPTSEEQSLSLLLFTPFSTLPTTSPPSSSSSSKSSILNHFSINCNSFWIDSLSKFLFFRMGHSWRPW